MVFPTGVAIDPDHDILYVSNRDAETFQDIVGRRIVAFTNASTIGPYDPASGIQPINNVKPTWQIEGDRAPGCSDVGCLPATDKTTLKRPAGLLLIPDPNPGDGVADDRLVVANRQNNTLLIYRGLSQKVALAAAGSPPDDNQAPTWTIADALFNFPFGLAYDGRTSDLYVSNISTDAATSRILVFNLASLALDQSRPSLQPRLIQGLSTGLSFPHGLALDPQLDR
jgi:hypothetical protein